MTGRGPAGGIVAVLLLAACGGEGGEASEEAAADSAPAGTPERVEAEPRLAVGGRLGGGRDAGPQEFYRVVTPFLLPDGRLVVPEAGRSTVRVFGPDGELAATLGGPGEGPGEFTGLTAAWPRGDTIEVFDGRLMRITRFLPDDSVEIVGLEPIQSAQSVVPGVLADGWVLYGVAEATYGERDRLVVHRFDRDGEHAGELARVRGMARYQAGNAAGPTPLSPRAFLDVHDGALYVGESLTPEVRVVRPSGEVERAITWEAERASPRDPGQVLARVVDSAVARAPEGRAETTRRRFETAPVPERLSVFWGLIVDERGFAWVRPYEPLEHAAALGGLFGVGSGGEWIVFSPAGERVGRVELPAGLEPVEITGDAVVGIARDELGVESVRVHALHRR